MAKQPTKKKVSADSKPAKKASAKAAAKPAKPATKTVARSAAKPSATAASKKKSPSAKPAPAAAKAKAPANTPASKLVKKAASAAAKPKAGVAQAPARPAAESTPPKNQVPASKAGGDAAKSGRKGITIVSPKPVKKTKPKSTTGTVPALTGSILGMGIGTGRPLIPSGPPSAATPTPDAEQQGATKKPKSPFTSKQLEKYREILIAKRRDLLGDIKSMETEALQSQSGSLSHLPQHMAEQGSETYEQSLSLDLAAADRMLLREIDAALQRIEDKTYGLCEHTGKPITKERLAELPWARYSIEAAREMERRTT